MRKLSKIIAIAAAIAMLLVPTASAAEHDEVIMGGMPFGLTMYTGGVVVIRVDEDSGSPAAEAGVRENDVITRANGREITSNEQLKEIVSGSGGEDIELSLYRGESPISLTVTPQLSDDGYTAGMWIRDSTAGLGTVTYFDEGSRSFGALGHGITDRDTGMLLPLSRGKAMNAHITSVTKAQPGAAGGLNGFMGSELIGEITVNNDFGVFGRYDSLPDGRRIACADDSEITTGEATISCTLDDSGIGEYAVEIEKLNLSDSSGQNMVIRVTDPELLRKTGGIVQGMSGSPITQNGKLIGAVTHVFVNSPDKGYGISISNMRQCYREYGGV